MAACKLDKNQFMTIRFNGNIYYGPFLTLYKTFSNKIIESFYKGVWYPSEIIAEEIKKPIICINDNLKCSKDLIIFTGEIDKSASDFKKGDLLNINKYDIEKISTSFTDAHVTSICECGESDWLFGIKILNSASEYYTLTDGYIVSVK